MTTAPDLAARVDAGAAWLDTVYPEWFTRIDVATLDVSLPCHCIIGQTFDGRTGEAAFNVFGEMAMLAVGDDDGTDWLWERGFLSDSNDYAALDELWVDAVKARYNQGIDA